MPPTPAERTFRVLRQPQGIDDARLFAELAVDYCGPACREASTMVFTELAENMVKYGAGGGTFAGTIALAVEGGVVRISASNAVARPADAKRVADAVARIAAARDVKVLYRARQETLLRNPALKAARLGLLRAAYEGGFRLSCRYAKPTLTVVAVRTCAK